MLDRIKAPFLYWLELYSEIRIWSIFRRAAFDNQKMLDTEHGLRVDWLGRIYGVINIPQEVEGAADQVQQAYVLQQITKYGAVMAKIGLADIVFPEIEKIKGSPAYLVVLWPEYESLAFWIIVGNLIRTSIIGITTYILIKLIVNNYSYLTELFNLTKDSIQSIL